MQTAIICAAPSDNVTALLGVLPFWLSLTALNAHAPAASDESAPTVRTWIEGTGLHLAATYGRAGGGCARVVVLEVTALQRPGARRSPYHNHDMALFLHSTAQHGGLEELLLEGVRLGPASAAELRRGLPAMHALRRLGLSKTGSCLCDVAPGIAHLTALENLHLGHIKARHGDGGRFAQQLGQMHRLRVLSVTCCNLGEAGWRAVLCEASKLPRLHTLSLDSSQLEMDGVWGRLAECQNPRWRSLEALGLGNSRGHRNPMSAGVVSFVRGLTGLTCLSLVHAHLTGEEAAEAVAPLPWLRALKLPGNGISESGMMALAPHLARLPHLTSIDLSLNQLGGVGAAVLGQCMPFMRDLQVCKLASNGIGDFGAVRLCECAMSARMLRKVTLVLNGITDKGAAAIGALAASAPAPPAPRSGAHEHESGNALHQFSRDGLRSVKIQQGCRVHF